MPKKTSFAKTIIKKLISKGALGFLSDKCYLSLYYKVKLGKKLNLTNPKTFTEKLQWLKLYDRKPIYTTMVDKYEAKKYVADIIGEKHVIRLLGVWEKFEDIDFELLPERFVLKCTHDSGGLVICRDKRTFDMSIAKKKINKSLKRNYFLVGREWPYKNVHPRIIAEEYIENTSGEELKDYKFFCFNGVPKIMYIANDIGADPRTDFFDMDFNHLDLHFKDPNADVCPSKPAQFEKMKELAVVLSKGIPQVRVDFYESNGEIFFGEFTFFHSGGFFDVHPDEWSERIGDWIELPTKTEI